MQKNMIKDLIPKIKKETNEEAEHKGMLRCRTTAAHFKATMTMMRLRILSRRAKKMIKDLIVMFLAGVPCFAMLK